MQFLYRDGADYVFMDTSSYEQMNAAPDSLGDAPRYLKEGDEAILQMYNGEIVGVDLPAAVELTVTETEPGMQGDRVSGARKAATLQTGLIVQVPLFVNTGDVLKVDTRCHHAPNPPGCLGTQPRASMQRAVRRATLFW